MMPYGLQNRISDQELLYLREYRCLDCGRNVEVLQAAGTVASGVLQCDLCGSVKLKELAEKRQGDFYW